MDSAGAANRDSAPETIFFDQYSRYRRCADIVRKILPAGGRILDVGSGMEVILKRFFEGDSRYDFWFVDPLFEQLIERETNLIVGDIFSTELDDAQYDLVLAIDTLEHVPTASRVAFLNRMIELSRGHIIIACPCADIGCSSEVDRFVDVIFREVSDRSYSWLQEHFEFGLPCLADILILFKQHQWRTVHYPNGFGPWLMELLPYVILSNEIGSNVDSLSKICRVFSSNLYAFDNREPAYRQFIIAGQSNKPLPIDDLRPPLDEQKIELALLQIRREMFLNPAIESRRTGHLLEEIRRRDRDIQGLNDAIHSASEHINKMYLQLEDQQRCIFDLNKLLHNASQEITSLQNRFLSERRPVNNIVRSTAAKSFKDTLAWVISVWRRE